MGASCCNEAENNNLYNLIKNKTEKRRSSITKLTFKKQYLIGIGGSSKVIH